MTEIDQMIPVSGTWPIADWRLMATKQRERTLRNQQGVRSQGVKIFALDLDAFGQSQCIFYINAKVPHRVFDFGVSQENWYGAQIAGRLVDNRRLRSPRRVSP